MAYVNNIVVENARIMFRNLSGKPTKFNSQGGKRTFALVIDDPENAQKLLNDGWNIKMLKPREDGEEPTYYLQVEASYAYKAPKIWMIAGRKKTLMTEDTVGCLDYSDIQSIDIVITPYHWNVGMKEGIKAYVKDMYVTIEEDYFSKKYDFDDPTDHPNDSFEDEDLPF